VAELWCISINGVPGDEELGRNRLQTIYNNAENASDALCKTS
jgi:hypothetical protein